MTVMQALQHVTHRFSSDVYGISSLSGISQERTLTAAPHDPAKALSLELASHLPQKLLAHVLSLHAPTLDLSASGLSHSPLMRIATCLQDLSPCPTIHAIHLSVPAFLAEADPASDDLTSDFEELLRAAGDLRSP